MTNAAVEFWLGEPERRFVNGFAAISAPPRNCRSLAAAATSTVVVEFGAGATTVALQLAAIRCMASIRKAILGPQTAGRRHSDQ